MIDLALRESTEESAVFGAITIRELMRADYTEAQRFASVGPDGRIVGSENIDRWHTAIVAAGVIGADGKAAYRREWLLSLPNRAVIWDEIDRLAQQILALSEVGPQHLKSGNLDDDADGAA